MTSPAQRHQLVAQSRLAYQTVKRRGEQTRQLVTASRQCWAQSRLVMTDPHRPLPGCPHVSAQPGEQAWVAPAAPLLSGVRRGRAAA